MNKIIFSVWTALSYLFLFVGAANAQQIVFNQNKMEVGTDFYLTEKEIITSARFDVDMSMGDILNLVDDSGTNLVIKPSAEAKTKVALFQVKCKSVLCNVKGKLKLTYPWGEPELIFEFLDYSENDQQNVEISLSEITRQTRAMPITLSGFASYGDSVESFLLKADLNLLSSDRVNIDLTNLADDKLVEFLEDCFGNCDRLTVSGDLYVSSSSSYLVAETVVKD